MKKTGLCLLLVVLMSGLMYSMVNAADTEKEEGFVSIFNGKDLTGWAGEKSLWSVQDGAIVGQTSAENPLKCNQSLAWKEECGNFVLRFDFWISKIGNSGFYYRGWYLNNGNKFQMGGYQGDFDGEATYSGIVYGEALRGIIGPRGVISKIGADHKPVVVKKFAESDALKSLVKIEDWNSYEIIADGFHFVHKINGKIMSELQDEDQEVRRASGLLGIQLHVGKPMCVKVKNIRIKKLD